MKYSMSIVMGAVVLGLGAVAARANETADDSDKMAGPRLLNLRYDEDFSYLDGPTDSYSQDWWDPMKRIHLNEDWTLSLGGELRARVEAEENKASGLAGWFGLRPGRRDDTFQLYRAFVHMDLRYRDSLRFFLQGIVAFDEDRDLAPRSVDENRSDFHQAFMDLRLDPIPWTLRVGRQELNYGNLRWIAAPEWDNIRQSFDGVKLFTRTDSLDVDVWWARPLEIRRAGLDDWNEEVNFYGAYAAYRCCQGMDFDFYFLGVNDRGNTISPNLRAGDRDTYTLGVRGFGNYGGFDYEAELAGQWGRWAGDNVRAWAYSVAGGYTFDAKCAPRFGVGFDYYSGDDDPFDGSVGTVNQLFGDNHVWNGYLDMIGRQNIMDLRFDLAAWVIPETVQLATAYHAFWLAEESDALYGPDGSLSRWDPFGNSGRQVGQELDITLDWQITTHESLLLGWSHLFADSYMSRTGSGEDANLAYLAWQYKF